MLQGNSLIAGDWIAGLDIYHNEPVNGPSATFKMGRVEDVSAACAAAEAAFEDYATTPRAARAEFLRCIADKIEECGPDLTAIGTCETGLPDTRLEGERGRTTGQLRLFADYIEAGDYLDIRHDKALPDRKPLPRPDLKMVQRPIGPVAVFGASNFPLAFSTAGGDTASALAAGCPVVVKAHPAHPGTGELVAQAIDAAQKASGMPVGVFSFIQDGGPKIGAALVQDPRIKAVGFTGSLRGGRALFDLCAARPEPIPFFGELGSVNPMFVMPGAQGARGDEIGKGWAASLTLGSGQFCTNPGIAVIAEGDGLDSFIDATRAALSDTAAQIMLTSSMANAYRAGVMAMINRPGVEAIYFGDAEGRAGAPVLLKVSAKAFLADPELAHEVFGPLGLIVVSRSIDDHMEVARTLEGQLTCTLHLDDADHGAARALMPVLERKAGRLLANGFPTGVEVANAMVHGGPYPASTNFGATSVGTLAIRRWLRPVCYQNMPENLLPEDLRP